VVLALLLGSFRAFEVVLFSTGGGPGFDTQIVGTYTYQFVTSGGSTIGYASAASVIVLIVAMAVSATQLLLTRTKDPNRRRRRFRRVTTPHDQSGGALPVVDSLPPATARPLQHASRRTS
jgi:ABC-type spermidine/putrescine transport system permease subunit I